MGETYRESLSLNLLNYSAVTGSSTEKWKGLGVAVCLRQWVVFNLTLVGGHRPLPGWPSAFPFCYVLFGWLSAFPWGGHRPFPLFSSLAGT